MAATVYGSALLAVCLAILRFRMGRCAPEDRLRVAGGGVFLAFLLCHLLHLVAAERIWMARQNLALLGARTTPRDLAFGAVLVLAWSFAGLMLLAITVGIAGFATVGRRPGVGRTRLLVGLALLVGVPVALGAFPVPGPAPGMEARAGSDPFLLDELRGPARELGWQMRWGSALPGLFLASAAAVHLARKERRAAEASGDPGALADTRRVLAGAGLLLFSVGGMLVEALALPRFASVIRWGPAARSGADLWLPFALLAAVPAAGCVTGFARAILHGYHSARWEDGRPAEPAA